ncbi:hypothetical protein SAMN05444280_11471 [Tangfeifania diversioriginum]|uniref:Uncharacterized protein n=1 Tax=Tangfeifania diversioriginum TaxID=1168035 RepID=A0A1M6HSQ2_9BACT|nr:hypothetical protein SAMN05444280_11471 [Tangfeifania diversioriginum]
MKMLICLNFMNKKIAAPSLRDFGFGTVSDSTITSCRWHWLMIKNVSFTGFRGKNQAGEPGEQQQEIPRMK